MLALLKLVTARSTVRPFGLKVGGRYKNGLGEIRTIVKKTDIHHKLFMHGYEFIDDQNEAYMPNGKWMCNVSDHRFDLVEEVPN